MQCKHYLQSWLVVALLLSGLGFTAYIKLYFQSSKNDVIVENAVVEQNCNLNKRSCSALLSENASIVFSILPREIPLLKPLDLQVRLKNIDAIEVEVEIKGINLNMGKFRTKLKADKDFIYHGISSLSVCSKKIMIWEAIVIVKSKQKIILAPFRFETRYNPTFIILE
jgi:hypothetical protein